MQKDKEATDVYSFESAARGYHFYRSVWNARIGEQLQATQDDDNTGTDLPSLSLRTIRQSGMFPDNSRGFYGTFSPTVEN